MAYVKLTNGSVDQYPYTVGQLRRDNPNTSFPKNISEETLNAWGVYRVSQEQEPSVDHETQYTERNSTPTYDGSSWVVGWTIQTKTAEEQEQYRAGFAESNREKRNILLSETDWWASSDLTMTAEQTAYRQALRDITTHANWPHLSEDDWPTKP